MYSYQVNQPVALFSLATPSEAKVKKNQTSWLREIYILQNRWMQVETFLNAQNRDQKFISILINDYLMIIII